MRAIALLAGMPRRGIVDMDMTGHFKTGRKYAVLLLMKGIAGKTCCP